MPRMTLACGLASLASGCASDASDCPDGRPFGGGGAFLGGACWDRGIGFDTGRTFDSGDAPPEEPGSVGLLIESYDIDCEPSGWLFTFIANEASAGGLLVLDQDADPALHEEHDVPGSLTLSLALPFAPTPDAQERDVNTNFTCEAQALTVFRFDLFRRTSSLADCVVWSGPETDPGVVYGADLDGCNNGNLW